MAETSRSVPKARTRAAPRKARKDPSEAPAFIAKTFEMVESSEDDVLGWTEDGTLFVVRDEDKFVEQLPKFFRHRNFRSFVRQLNFYGFRKLRVEELKSKPPSCSKDVGQLFHHQHFRRGRPELLKLIKPKRVDADVDTEVVELRDQVKSMEGKIEHMTSEIERLTGMVTVMLEEQQAANASRKRHRNGQPVLSPPPSPEVPPDDPASAMDVPPSVPSLSRFGSSSLRWMDSVGDDEILPEISVLQLDDMPLERSTSVEVMRQIFDTPAAGAAAVSSEVLPGSLAPVFDPSAACQVKSEPGPEVGAFGA